VKLTRRAACRVVLHGLAGASATLLLAGAADAANRRNPQFHFTESYARKVVRVDEPDGSKVFEPVESGKFTLYARLPLDSIDSAAFNEDTAVTIALEDTVFDVLLGDDPSYSPGRTSAQISYSDTDDSGITLVYLSILLRWNSKELTVRVRGRTPDFQDSIIAVQYLDDFTGPYEDVSDAAITVEDTTFNFDVDYTGRVTTRTVVRGPEREEFDVSSTSLKAKGTPAGVDQLGRRSQRHVRKA